MTAVKAKVSNFAERLQPKAKASASLEWDSDSHNIDSGSPYGSDMKGQQPQPAAGGLGIHLKGTVINTQNQKPTDILEQRSQALHCDISSEGMTIEGMNRQLSEPAPQTFRRKTGTIHIPQPPKKVWSKGFGAKPIGSDFKQQVCIPPLCNMCISSASSMRQLLQNVTSILVCVFQLSSESQERRVPGSRLGRMMKFGSEYLQQNTPAQCSVWSFAGTAVRETRQ